MKPLNSMVEPIRKHDGRSGTRTKKKQRISGKNSVSRLADWLVRNGKHISSCFLCVCLPDRRVGCVAGCPVAYRRTGQPDKRRTSVGCVIDLKRDELQSSSSQQRTSTLMLRKTPNAFTHSFKTGLVRLRARVHSTAEDGFLFD